MLAHAPHDLAVPDRVEIVETDAGRRALTYSGGSSHAAPGALMAFIRLERLEGQALEDALLKFVRRHGPLRICKEHDRHLSGDHEGCEPHYPEPVDLWHIHSGTAGLILRLFHAWLDDRPLSGKELDELVAGESLRNWSEEIFPKVERLRRRGELSSHAIEYWTEKVNASHEYLEGVRRNSQDFAKERLGLDDYGVLRPARAFLMAKEYLAACLEAHRPRVRLTESGMVFQPAGLLGAIYLEFASEITGLQSIYFCTGCGNVYSPKRRPRTGDRRFCSSCREAGIPVEMAKRDKRRRDAKA